MARQSISRTKESYCFSSSVQIYVSLWLLYGEQIVKPYLNKIFKPPIVLLTINSKLEGIYGLEDGWRDKCRVMVLFRDLKLRNCWRNQSPVIFARSCRNNSKLHAFFQGSFPFWRAQCCHVKQRLIFSGGILTPFFPPQHIYHASLLPEIEREKTIQDERM